MTSGIRKWALRAAAAPLLALAIAPSAASAETAPALRAALQAAAEPGLARFYGPRHYRPIWVKNGFLVPEAARMIAMTRDAELDGMVSARELASELERAVNRAGSGDPRDQAYAELMLSRALVRYVETLRRPADAGMVYADSAVAPSVPFRTAILSDAAAAPSLSAHLDKVSAVNPLYSQLRGALAALRDQPARVFDASATTGFGDDPRQIERRLKVNLERARALPVSQSGRYVLVDAVSARLWLYEDGKPRDSMKVIIGKPSEPTPMVASMIRTAVLNPYWNVPPDLVRKKVAPKVLEEGLGYLKKSRYEVLSDWTENAVAVDPETIDWEAVAAGREELRVRQLPGAGNSMGDMKFMFPNEFGVYLHDTPDKALFAQDDRKLSSGCVRVEDAKRLAQWLFGSTPRAPSSAPEQVVALPEPVPVYITYLTVDWDGERLAMRDDPYSRDGDGNRRFASAMAGSD